MKRRPAAPSSVLAITLLASAIAACGTGAGSATAPAVDATTSARPAVSAPAGTPVASAADATASPTAASLGSPAYRYRMTVPAGLAAGAPVAAVTPWDGASRIDSDGPSTDKLYLSGSRLLFAYGAPSDLGLEAYAKAGQAQKAAWHGCPSTPDSVTEATFGGGPALLYSFECGGLHVLSLYTVHDGSGLVVNLLSPPGDVAADDAAFRAVVSGSTWAD